jgi:hypothetical protein
MCHDRNVTAVSSPGASGDSHSSTGGGRRFEEHQWVRVIWAGAFPLALALAIAVYAILTYRSPAFIARRPPVTAFVQLTAALLAVAALTGTASMAIVQVAKNLFNLRGLYQERQIRQWLADRGSDHDYRSFSQLLEGLGLKAASQVPNKGEAQPTPDTGTTSPQTTKWRWPSDADRAEVRRFFGLPIEQLTPQIGAVAELASAEGNRLALLKSLAGKSGWPKIDQFAARTSGPSPTPAAGQPAAQTGGQPAQTGGQPAQTGGQPAQTGGQPAAQTGREGEEVELRLELAHLIRGGLDQLQVSIGERWRHYARATAAWLSGALALIMSYVVHLSPGVRTVSVLSALILGGFFSWLARDLVAVVERIRR